MRIQLWSYNYDPEPTGIGPVSRVFVEGLGERGHDIDVVAAHPHYPDPIWGSKLLPYRERRDSQAVLRLPLWIGRNTAAQRYRQELSFTMSQAMATPTLPSADVLVSVSPSFPALIPAMVNARARRTPWVLWLHDILPDGAVSSGIVGGGSPVIQLARRVERAAYRNADRIVVLSEAFVENLMRKGVPEGKLQLIYPPATRSPGHDIRFDDRSRPHRVLSMGNIGYSQGLASLVNAFEHSQDLADIPVRFIITGKGVASEEARAEIRTERIEMPGVVDDERLEKELQEATITLVSQRHDGAEFNIPSKIMNFMTYGLPILAAVNPNGEVARIVERSGAGWVVDSSEPETFPRKLVEILSSPQDIQARGRAAYEYAKTHFTQANFAERFDGVLGEVVDAYRSSNGPDGKPD